MAVTLPPLTPSAGFSYIPSDPRLGTSFRSEPSQRFPDASQNNLTQSVSVLLPPPARSNGVATTSLPSVSAGGVKPSPMACNPCAATGPHPSRKSFAELFSSSAVSSPAIQIRKSATYRGKPAVFFSSSEVDLLAQPFRFALVGKFSHGRPLMHDIRTVIDSFGLKGSHFTGLLDSKHILMRFDNEQDFQRIWCKERWVIKRFPMRVFKWTVDFHVDFESPFVPLWINLPLLPIHYYNKAALFSIASGIGTPMRLDQATVDLARPSLARLCVEVDVSSPLHDRIWIGMSDDNDCGFWQEIVYEHVPLFCSFCHKLGHDLSGCYIKNPAIIPPKVSAEPQASKSVFAQLEKRPAAPLSRPPQAAPKPKFTYIRKHKHQQTEANLQAAPSADLCISNAPAAPPLRTAAAPAADFAASPPPTAAQSSLCTKNGVFSNLIDLETSIPRPTTASNAAVQQQPISVPIFGTFDSSLLDSTQLEDLLITAPETSHIDNENVPVNSQLNAGAAEYIPQVVPRSPYRLHPSPSLDNFMKFDKIDYPSSVSSLVQSLVLANVTVTETPSSFNYNFDDIKAKLRQDKAFMDHSYAYLSPVVKVKPKRPTGRPRKFYANGPPRRSKRLQI